MNIKGYFYRSDGCLPLTVLTESPLNPRTCHSRRDVERVKGISFLWQCGIRYADVMAFDGGVNFPRHPDLAYIRTQGRLISRM